MKLLIPTLLLTAAFSVSAATLSELSQLLWHHRIILVQCDTEECQQTSVAQLQQAELAVKERHIVWFVSSPASIQSNASIDIATPLQQALTSTDLARPQAILIGKDGDIKHASEQLQLELLFDKIDQMPMRQSEMKLQRI
ncbi:DUF4174 domain-containing protein [Neiella sp. HB171785]|uniref:DUF4174 domain-containing protein n=1 Tax=Neiella litorisoli TaxID=2771431 RepID=A0A8J6QTV7_9GAMM|nr:DUF4174 domain-containing protein [Neiella litorisoli]MBD1389197.1 DUF4174 domain-containing protein [Neiella litorisoli]